MTAGELEAYLHRHIPLSAAMGASVRTFAEDEVVLEAAFEPNLNHQSTAFGGSIVTLGILSGWAYVHFRLRGAGIETHTVIQRSEMHYRRPITGAFTARCGDVPEDAWAHFIRALERRGRARIEVEAVLECDGEEAGRFEGVYVATVR